MIYVRFLKNTFASISHFSLKADISPSIATDVVCVRQNVFSFYRQSCSQLLHLPRNQEQISGY